MKVSIYWLGQATGKHPATIRKRIASIIPDDKGKYDSTVALQAIYIGIEGSKVTTEEAIRQLNVARKEEIDLDMEIKRKERLPIADCLAVDNEVFQAIAGTIKANRNKQLSEEVTNEIFDNLRDWAGRLNGNGKHD